MLNIVVDLNGFPLPQTVTHDCDYAGGYINV